MPRPSKKQPPEFRRLIEEAIRRMPEGFSTRELSERLGFAAGYLQSIKDGAFIPAPNRLRAICKALDIDYDEALHALRIREQQSTGLGEMVDRLVVVARQLPARAQQQVLEYAEMLLLRHRTRLGDGAQAPEPEPQAERQ